MIEWIVTSSVLILLVIAIRYFFRNSLALWARYALWLVVALRLLIPISFFESSFSVLNLMNAEKPAVMERNTGDLPETEITQDPDSLKPLDTVQTGARHENINIENSFISTADKYADSGSEPESAEDGYVKAAHGYADTENGSEKEENGQADAQKAGDAGSASRTFDIKEKFWLIPWIWLMGAIQCAGIVFMVNHRYRKRVYRSRKEYNAHGQSKLPVYVSWAVCTPCMFGLFHPSIYLTPMAMEDKKALRYVLCHENTHYRHRDNWWALVRTACICIHWYNPLVWTAAYLSRQDCELACDEETLRQLGEEERIGYGRSLLAFSAQDSVAFGGLQLSTTMVGGKKQLKERLLKITSHTKNYKSALISVAALAVMALMTTFTGGKGGQDKVYAQDSDARRNDFHSQEDTDASDVPGSQDSNSAEEDTGKSDRAPGEEESQERQHFVERVTVEQKDGENYVLQIDSDTVLGSGTYEINEIQVLWQQDGREEVVQSIHPGDVKALYTISGQDLDSPAGNLSPWMFSSDEEPLFAKTLYSAEDLPQSAVGWFQAEDGGQMLSYASNGGILVADLNFDGYDDFCVQTDVGSINIPYYCFLWNPTEGKFEHGSMIPNVQVDEEAQCIKSITKDSEALYSIKYYKFDENNALHLVRYVEENQSPDAVFPLLDLTYYEGLGYELPAVDDWDYLSEYGGALTERLVYWAKQALTELYEWSGTKIDTVSFTAIEFGAFYFANSPEDMRVGRTFYDRVYGKRAGFRECIESMDLVTERVVWYSNVTQWNVPENLHDMTNAQVAEWYLERSALAEGETVAEIQERFEDTFVFRMESGNYYEVTMNLDTSEVGSVYGPYDSYPWH